MQDEGRLGMGKDDLKEMRVLNRIVRITEDALLYEADPRHAEMLIQSFQLEGSKAVVTPGVKVNVDERDADTIDSEAAKEIRQIIAMLQCKRTAPSKVRFCPHVKRYNVPAYSQIYGQHPRTFNFDDKGRMINVFQE